MGESGEPLMEEPNYSLESIQFDEPQKQEWLVDGVIARNGLTVIYGPQKTYKTFLVTDIALSAASGIPWKGHAVDKLGLPVTYVAMEGADNLKYYRVPAWLKHYEQNSDVGPVSIVREPLYLLSDRHVEDFIDTVGRDVHRFPSGYSHKSPRLVVVDTLARTFWDGDENNAKDMTGAVQALDRIRQELSTAIVVVHHTGKDADKGARGSSVLEAAADSVFSVKAPKKNRIVLTNKHQRFTAPLAPMTLDLKEVTGSTVEFSTLVVGDEVEAAPRPLDRSSRQEEALAALKNIGPARRSDFAKASGLKGGTFDRALKALEEDGLIEKRAGLYYPTLAPAA